jgi:shikimate kinase
MSSAGTIVLIGFMGAGKSSVGRCLQNRTGLARFDVDETISTSFQLSIPQIFSTYGEERFREAETETLRELSPNPSSIIVTGGGIVLRGQNIDLLKRLGTVVWLDAREEILFERATRKGDRPLLQTDKPRTKFSKLLRIRAPLYANAAEIRIDTSELTHEEVVDAILSKIDHLVLSKK